VDTHAGCLPPLLFPRPPKIFLDRYRESGTIAVQNNLEEITMSNLPVASYLATELVARQFEDRVDDRPRPAQPVSQPVRRTRVALAEALERAAAAVAPAGYRPAH
jgi:hypothetical protein